LPEDVNHETGLEKVIGQVATFKMPAAATGKGVYELKVHSFISFIPSFIHSSIHLFIHPSIDPSIYSFTN
jgi:E3 ubiquitin-protein ligase UBR2